MDGSGWLRGFAEAALAAPGERLPPSLAALYESERALQRAIELRRTTLASLFVYVMIVVGLNFVVAMHVSWANIVMMVILAPAIALAIASLFFRPDTPPLAREVAAIVAVCFFILTVVLAVSDVPAELAQFKFSLACLPVMFVLSFGRPRLIAAQIYAGVSISALAVALLMRTDLAVATRACPMAILLLTSLPPLVAVRRREHDARRLFLYGLLTRLYRQEVREQGEQPASVQPAVTGAAEQRFEASLSDAAAGGGNYSAARV